MADAAETRVRRVLNGGGRRPSYAEADPSASEDEEEARVGGGVAGRGAASPPIKRRRRSVGGGGGAAAASPAAASAELEGDGETDDVPGIPNSVTDEELRRVAAEVRGMQAKEMRRFFFVFVCRTPFSTSVPRFTHRSRPGRRRPRSCYVTPTTFPPKW